MSPERPRLLLNSGGTAVYASGSGTNTLNFTDTVAAGDNAARPGRVRHLGPDHLGSGGSIQDLLGDSAYLDLRDSVDFGDHWGRTRTSSSTPPRPTVTGVTSATPDGSYGVGATISVRVRFDEPVVRRPARRGLAAKLRRDGELLIGERHQCPDLHLHRRRRPRTPTTWTN